MKLQLRPNSSQVMFKSVHKLFLVTITTFTEYFRPETFYSSDGIHECPEKKDTLRRKFFLHLKSRLDKITFFNGVFFFEKSKVDINTGEHQSLIINSSTMTEKYSTSLAELRTRLPMTKTVN
ncbi:hypothetical protein L596_025698 [Steinernema carpocapsae]|uniref:Uncharacterized protein n=1 Tax=Steinernema carpocapsae TaxID=34508 RepID=A0A4U5M8J2_STECR|nr:hypothetical protein L596_025698 [Steinernema carpocapsae]